MWDKGVDNSKALQFSAKLTPNKISADFHIPSQSGSLELEQHESGVLGSAKYGPHFVQSEVEWRRGDGLYGLKGSLNSSVTYLDKLKGVDIYSLKEVKEGRKVSGQVCLPRNN